MEYQQQQDSMFTYKDLHSISARHTIPVCRYNVRVKTTKKVQRGIH